MTRRGGSAFTLLELTIVMVIVVVIAGIGITRAGSARTEYRAKLAAQRLACDLAEASRQSLYRSTTVSLKFDKSNNLYTITGLYTDGEVITVDLAAGPYHLAVAHFEADGKNNMTYSGGVPSTDQPVLLTVEAGADHTTSP